MLESFNQLKFLLSDESLQLLPELIQAAFVKSCLEFEVYKSIKSN